MTTTTFAIAETDFLENNIQYLFFLNLDAIPRRSGNASVGSGRGEWYSGMLSLVSYGLVLRKCLNQQEATCISWAYSLRSLGYCKASHRRVSVATLYGFMKYPNRRCSR